MLRQRPKVNRKKLSSLADVCDKGTEIIGTACVRQEYPKKKTKKKKKKIKKNTSDLLAFFQIAMICGLKKGRSHLRIVQWD